MDYIIKSSRATNQDEDVEIIKEVGQTTANLSKVQSHFLVSSDKLDKLTRRVIAPYAQIERKGLKEEDGKDQRYLDLNRFNVFLDDMVDLDSLLYETAMVLKTVTNSSGVFLYIVNETRNEIVLLPHHTKTPERHEINIPIGEGKTVSAHVAFTKEYMVIEDVQRDARFAEGQRWVDARALLCVPIVKPDGGCYAVLELYRTFCECYDDNMVYTAVSLACWAGAAVHQAQARITLHRSSHLNDELRALLQSYFCDLASIDTMLTDMLAIVKSFIGAMRSSFYIIDKERVGDGLYADMWDDGWSSETSLMPKKRVKVNLGAEQTPAGLVARTGEALNVCDAYKDPRFLKEIDPTTGTVVRSCLVSPIMDKTGVIGVVQLTNKLKGQPFTAEDEKIFGVFISYCSLIVHFYNMQQKNIFHENLNKVYNELMSVHLKPCSGDMQELLNTNGVIVLPSNFHSFDYHISEGNKEDIPGLLSHMFTETFADQRFDRHQLADFILTILKCYRDNPYHNAEHAFCFTHTVYLILINNPGRFEFVETVGMLLAGLCHDVDHPGYNNNFLALCHHPLSLMYASSTLEHHHYFLTKKIIQDKKIFAKLSSSERERIMDEIRYAILCTDLAVYFHIRAELTPVVAEQRFDWSDNAHRMMLKVFISVSNND
ncbi:hypothetical protein ACJJTC_017332 [Scirpophaga incertulas]